MMKSRDHSSPHSDAFVDGKIEAQNLKLLGVTKYVQAIASGEGLPYWSDLQEQLDDCAQNPDRRGKTQDDRFMVFVPVSGGLDSMTALAMAVDSGHNVCAVYVNTGAAYSAAEKEAVGVNVGGHMAAILKDGRQQSLHFETLEMPVIYKKYEHVDRGRNLIAIVAIANYAREMERWGELWFGNVGEYGESGVIAGDKSHRFFIEMNVMLREAGFPIEVRSPLVGLNKTDLVRWWLAHYDDADKWLGRQWSCHSQEPEHCGQCSGCWSRWVAFKELGMAAIPPMPVTDFSSKVALAKERWDNHTTTSLAHSRVRLIRYLKAMDIPL
jgi:7-cyano-7-deazaguanine synthase in queuosine biosynthesis